MMSPVLAIWKKDLKGFLTSPMFFSLLGFCCCLWALFFSFQVFTFAKQSYQITLQGGKAGMNIHHQVISAYVVVVHYVLIFILAALSLRFFAEEKKMKTFPILLTSPLTSWQIVLAKWLVGVSVLGILLLVSMVFPLSLTFFVKVPLGLFFYSYFGVFLILTVYMTAGLLASSTTESLIICVVLSLVFSISLLLLGVGRELTDAMALQEFFYFLTFDRHFTLFRKGLLSLSSIFYFLSLSAVLALITERVVEFHRWR